MKTHLIKSFLKEAGSDLHSLMDSMSLGELCFQMQIARGSKEYVKPINAGLLLFTDNPEKHFRDTRIEVVEYQDDIGDKFTEKILLLATIKGKQLATIKRQVKSKGVIRKRLKFECIADQKYRPTADVLFLPIPPDFRG